MNVYFDHSATTPVAIEVIDEMQRYLAKSFANPSSAYSIARENKQAIDKARIEIARMINAEANEIFFTSGGSESDNWAIKGLAFADKNKNHIITSKIEHPAVLNTCKYLETMGFEVDYLNVDRSGIVSTEELCRAIKKTTALISIMFANNEIGTIQPVGQIGSIAKQNNIYFHTDAVQAIGNIKIDVKRLNIDMLSMSAHKFYGPKGIGVLYIKKGIGIDNLIHGGGQEFGLRAGTENISGIVGMAKAIYLSYEGFEKKRLKLLTLRERLIDGIIKNIPQARINGDRQGRLPGNANFSFDGIKNSALLVMLDEAGIQASGASACKSSEKSPSHVLKAIGLSDDEAIGSIRFTMGYENTIDEVDYVVEKVVEYVRLLKSVKNY